MSFGPQEILRQRFRSCPPHPRNVAAVPCEMRKCRRRRGDSGLPMGNGSSMDAAKVVFFDFSGRKEKVVFFSICSTCMANKVDRFVSVTVFFSIDLLLSSSITPPLCQSRLKTFLFQFSHDPSHRSVFFSSRTDSTDSYSYGFF